MAGYIRFPFGTAGDRATIPQTTQPDGSVSWQQGFGPKYALASGDPNKLNIPRDKTNEAWYAMSLAIQIMQQSGFPDWITAAENGGVSYPYAANATVRYSDGKVYTSAIDNNTDTPGTSANWVQTLLIGQSCVASDRKAANTGAGNSAAGIQTRTLNDFSNSIPGASLSGNQITLPAGRYRVNGSAPCEGGNAHRVFLYSVTGAAYLLPGTNENTSQSGTEGITTRSFLQGSITLSATTVLELRHWIEDARTNGLGIAVNDGTGQQGVFATIEFVRVG